VIRSLVNKEADYIVKAKNLLIDGYLLREDSFNEVARCIRMVLSGRQYFSPSFDRELLFSAEEELANMNQLTASEKMILRPISEQTTTQDIAAALGVSAPAIEKHRSNIIQKL
jgi:DNA-binding NarL/FixJ family response regulator